MCLYLGIFGQDNASEWVEELHLVIYVNRKWKANVFGDKLKRELFIWDLSV